MVQKPGVQAVQWTGTPDSPEGPEQCSKIIKTLGGWGLATECPDSTGGAYSTAPTWWGGAHCPCPKTPPLLSPLGLLQALSFGPLNWGSLTYCWTVAPQSLAMPVILSFMRLGLTASIVTNLDHTTFHVLFATHIILIVILITNISNSISAQR